MSENAFIMEIWSLREAQISLNSSTDCWASPSFISWMHYFKATAWTGCPVSQLLQAQTEYLVHYNKSQKQRNAPS